MRTNLRELKERHAREHALRGTKRNVEAKIAEALRTVAAKLIDAVDAKYINRCVVDADTLHETLMAVADEIDK
jgi:hypothetical protein